MNKMKISKRNLKKIVQEEIASVLNFDLSKGPSDKTAVASMLLETALGIVPSYKQVREHLKKENSKSGVLLLMKALFLISKMIRKFFKKSSGLERRKKLVVKKRKAFLGK